ncbi:hypothetical protein L0F63_000403 [Massospora cicadina]|nr:hypothetical protein L0F63_000403 [Massospora cicadina]
MDDSNGWQLNLATFPMVADGGAPNPQFFDTFALLNPRLPLGVDYFSFDPTLFNPFEWYPTPPNGLQPVAPLPHRDRSHNWSSEETATLLDTLIANKQRLDEVRRHPELWHQLAEALRSKGYSRSPEKCKNRWKVLVAKYKRYLRPQTNSDFDTFEFFDKLTALLHAKFTVGPAAHITKFKLSTN